MSQVFHLRVMEIGSDRQREEGGREGGVLWGGVVGFLFPFSYHTEKVFCSRAGILNGSWHLRLQQTHSRDICLYSDTWGQTQHRQSRRVEMFRV